MFCWFLSAGGLVYAQGPIDLSASTTSDQITVDSKVTSAWQTSKDEPVLNFQPPEDAPFPSPSGTSYLAVTYLDRGYGRLGVTYKTADGQWRKPDKVTQPVRLDTERWVTAYARCPDPLAMPPEVRVQLEGGSTNPLTVARVSLQGEPFADEHFRFLLAEDWQRPYQGVSHGGTGERTLRGKVMVGYQGWFRTPNDPYDTGWRHWGDLAHGTFSVDMWPDTSLYPPQTLDKANDVRTLSGRPGYLFSPGWPEVVDRHFALMRAHGIDGAFVQRFVSRSNLHALGGGPEWVLGNVRAAANREGRLWAVEYDVSGCPDGELLDDIKQDWAWLVDRFGLRQDPAYAHEGARPVVFVWGMELPDRHISVATADAVVDFLQHDPAYGGNYVIGGLPGPWGRLDAAWQQHIARYDGALAWQSQNYAQDVADFHRLGIDCYPHVWPGFSWANLKHLPTDSTVAFTPREGGKYYEGLLARAIEAGVDRLFVGMFDEYDEGTAILPMSDDPPPPPTRPGVNLKVLENGENTERTVNVHLPGVELTFDGIPPFKGTPASDFAVRYEGKIIPPASGRYTFRVEGPAGDQAELSIGDARSKFGPFPDASAPTLATVLTEQPVSFHLDFRHGDAPGTVRLRWELPGQPQSPVPASAFIDTWGRFLTNEGQPADRWLTLTGKWKSELVRRLKESANVQPAPEPPAQ